MNTKMATIDNRALSQEGGIRAEDVRVLFLAKYAPGPLRMPPSGRDQSERARYHGELFQALLESFPRAVPLNTVEELEAEAKPADFLFSLLHNEPFVGREVLVPALAEQRGIPYVGARPPVRGVVEDKHLSKVLSMRAGIATPDWATFDAGGVFANDFNALERIDPPYFVKPRYGANSDSVSEASICESAPKAEETTRALLGEGIDVIVERYVDGTLCTVPVWTIEGKMEVLPGVIQAPSDSPVLMPRHKIDPDFLPERKIVEDRLLQREFEKLSLSYCGLIAPVDYARIDFILERGTGRLHFIEANVCCGISSRSTFFASARGAFGYDYGRFVKEIVLNSMRRQYGSVIS